MKQNATPASNLLEEPYDFSLVLGGPLYQLWLRTKLARPTMELVHRRILAAIAVTWVPLALLALLTGNFFLGSSHISFLEALSAHVRLLVAVPLLLVAEVTIHRRFGSIVGQFTERELIAPEDRPRFEAAMASALRLRDSVLAEVLLFVIVYVAGFGLSRVLLAGHVATWLVVPVGDGVRLTLPGYWYVFVSLPLFRFILARWYFRLFIWYRFLWQVSRLKLKLNALHPDHAGGLEFLNYTLPAMAPLLMAQSAVLAGEIGVRILHLGAKLPDFKFDIVAAMVFLLLLALLPSVFFLFQLAEARRVGLREYGKVATKYTREFRNKWLKGHADPDEPLLGTGDIQSLADLSNSFEVVEAMGLVPFDLKLVIRLAVMIALPLAPLALTMMSLDEIVSRLVQMIL